MARKITAIRTYRPEINRAPTLQTAEVIREMCRATTLSEGAIYNVVYQMQEVILMAHRDGRAVKIEGLGTFTPTIRMDGRFDILFRPDADVLRQLNFRDEFHAKLLNKANIGKSADDLVALWNEEHPEDPVEE
jgi:hypothetical protein